MPRYDPNAILDCYARGVFPMAESRDDAEVFLVDPEMRGIFKIGELKISRSLAKTLRRAPFDIAFDSAFMQVVLACAAPRKSDSGTWINTSIEQIYSDLFAMGHAHSVECWQNGKLVGGLYGVSLGGAFFGESMFSRQTDASKVALVHLMRRLEASGFRLLDAQFITDHLRSLGAIEVTRAEYRKRLSNALAINPQF